MAENIQLNEDELNQDVPADVFEKITDEDIKKTLQTEHVRKLHFKSKFEVTSQKLAETEAELAKFKTQPPPKNEGQPDEINNRLGNLEFSEAKRQFASQYGYTAEETDKLFAYAKGIGKEPHTIIDDPFVKTAITVLRQSKANADATPAPSGSTIVVEGKKWSEMSNDERKKNFGKVFQK